MSHHARAREHDRPSAPVEPLPATRAELLVLHRLARRRRAEADLGGDAWAAASMEVGRIEVEIARIERAMDPPAG